MASRYDKERQSYGLTPVGASSSSVGSPRKSRYDEERAQYKYNNDFMEYQEQMKPARLMEIESEQGQVPQKNADLSQVSQNFQTFRRQLPSKVQLEAEQEAASLPRGPNGEELKPRPPYWDRVKEKVGSMPSLLRPLAAPFVAFEQLPAMMATSEMLGGEHSIEKGYLPVSGGGKVAGQIGATISHLAGAQGAGLLAGGLYQNAGNVLNRYAPQLANSVGGRISSSVIKGVPESVAQSVGGTLAINPQATPQELKDATVYGAGFGFVPGVGRGLKEVVDYGKRGVSEALGNAAGAFNAAENAVQYPGSRLKLDSRDQNLARIRSSMSDEVDAAMTPAIESERALRQWLKPHLGNPSNRELEALGYDDLLDLAESVRVGLNRADVEREVAKKYGVDLGREFDEGPSIRAQVRRDNTRRAFGGPEPSVRVNRPIFRESNQLPLSSAAPESPFRPASVSESSPSIASTAAPSRVDAKPPNAGIPSQSDTVAARVSGTNKTVDIPKTLYHGTTKDFSGDLTPGEDGVVWFGLTPEIGAVKTKLKSNQVAGDSGRVIKATPDIKNVFVTDLTGELNRDTMQRMADQGIDALYDMNKGHIAYIGHLRKGSANKPRVDVTPADEIEEVVQAVRNPRVRDRVTSYLDEAEKAARERIRKRGNRLSSNPLDEWGDYAIIMGAKLGKGTIKAADFTEALVKEFGESMRPHAAKVLARTREVLRTQERRASKEGRDAATFNAGGGDASTFESKITRGKKRESGSFSDWWEGFKTQFTEDIAPLNRLERNVKGSIPSAEQSLYKSARLYKGVPEKINQFVDQRLKPIVRGIEKQGYHSDDLGRYSLAVHAKDVNAAGYKSGYTNSEIDDVIRRLGTIEMEAARKSLVQINRDLLDDLVNNNVISAELRDALNDRWKNYIPMFRDIDDVVGNSTGLSDSLANVASPIKRLKGSEKNVLEPLENMVQNIIKNISASERNKVSSFIPQLSKLDPENKFIRKMGENESKEGKNAIYVKENGENVYYEVDPDVRSALMSLDTESSNWWNRFLERPASWLRAGATLTPEFMLRNPIRDYRNARIVSESGFRIDDYAVGLASSLMGKFGKGKLYQEWVENLGAYGNIISEDRKVFAAAQRKVLTQSTKDKFVNIVNPKSFIRLLRAISDISESSTKVGEYRAALRSGTTKEEAAYRARDIMDFARAGASIRQTNKIVAFLNANIQGKSKVIRAFKNQPVKASIRAFKSVAVPSAGVYFFNKAFASDEQKEKIRNAPDWQRNTFWLVAVPGTEYVARIPKPFDFAVVANVVERSLDFYDQKDQTAFDRFVNGVVANNSIPIMVSGLQPMIEGAFNVSAFKQGPVIPKRDAGLNFEDQYDPIRTSETAKGIAKAVDFTLGGMGGNFRSPYIIDNTINGFFAGGGKYATDAIDAILGATGISDKPKAPAKTLEQKPVTRSFLIDSNQGGQDMDIFYRNKERLDRAKASAQRNMEPLNDGGMTEYLGSVSESINKINAQVRMIEKSGMSSQEKRFQIDQLLEVRNKLVKDTVQGAGLR